MISAALFLGHSSHTRDFTFMRLKIGHDMFPGRARRSRYMIKPPDRFYIMFFGSDVSIPTWFGRIITTPSRYYVLA